MTPQDTVDAATVRTHPTGYCPDTRPFAEWREAGLLCPWHHCIETTPLKANSSNACPWFGPHPFRHECPNGAGQAENCLAVKVEVCNATELAAEARFAPAS